MTQVKCIDCHSQINRENAVPFGNQIIDCKNKAARWIRKSVPSYICINCYTNLMFDLAEMSMEHTTEQREDYWNQFEDSYESLYVNDYLF